VAAVVAFLLVLVLLAVAVAVAVGEAKVLLRPIRAIRAAQVIRVT